MIQTPRRRMAAFLLLVLALGSSLLSAEATARGDTPSRPVNLNTASAAELETLPGVGEVRARAIIAKRKERGGFRSLDQLGEVKGFGPQTVERLRPMLTLGSGPPAPRP